MRPDRPATLWRAAVVILLLAIWAQLGGMTSVIDAADGAINSVRNMGKKDEEAAPWNGEGSGGLGDAYRYENERAIEDLIARPPASAPAP